jgi:hypothetical protein
MTITFETDSDVIVYALERIVSFAKEKQYLFVANWAWWIDSVIGLEQGLIIYIDNLKERERLASSQEQLRKIHPNRVKQVASKRAISATPRDPTEDQRRVHFQSIGQSN